MAQNPILNMPVAASLSGAEWVPSVQGGTNVRFQAGLLLETPGSVQNANTVFAGPTSGAAAAPVFRALVNDDLPIVSIAKGGTGEATAIAGFDALAPTTTRGDLIYRNATVNARLALGANDTLLGSDGTDASWRTAAQVKASLGYPTVSVDNTVPRFDGIAGNLQTSGVTIDDSNNLTVPGQVLSNIAASAPASGNSGWDTGAGAQIIVRTTAANAAGVGSAITFQALNPAGGGAVSGYAAIDGGIAETGTYKGFLSILLRTDTAYATERTRLLPTEEWTRFLGTAVDQSGLFRQIADTTVTPVIQLASGGWRTERNTAGAGDFSSKEWVGIRNYNWSRTATSGLFFNPSNLPIVSDIAWYEKGDDAAFVSENQLVLNSSYQSLTPTVVAQSVTAVTVSPDLTGYSANQTVGWTAYQSGAIYAQGTVQATAGGVINTAQFALATGLPTAAIFTSTPLILVQLPNVVGNTAILDTAAFKLSRQPPDVYPAANSYLWNILQEGFSGSGGVKGPLVEYVGLAGIVGDPETGSEDGIWDMRRMVAGTLDHIYFGAGMYRPGITGGDKGVGTINMTSLWEAGERVVTKDIGGNVSIGGQFTAVTAMQVSRAIAQPELSTFRSDAHGAAALIGRVAFYGRDSAVNTELYAAIYGIADDDTSTSEDGSLHFYTVVGGTFANRMILTGAQALKPATADTLALGTAALPWSDIDLASGAVLRFDNAMTLTHAATSLTLAGGNLIFPGTATNDDAAAGQVGELISSDVESGSAVSLTNGAGANVTSISLTAGDWEVTGIVHLSGNGATTVSNAFASVSTTSATLSNTAQNASQIWGNGNTLFAAATYVSLPRITRRVSIASTTTVYLVVLVVFGVNTCAAFGSMRARRVR